VLPDVEFPGLPEPALPPGGGGAYLNPAVSGVNNANVAAVLGRALMAYLAKILNFSLHALFFSSTGSSPGLIPSVSFARSSKPF